MQCSCANRTYYECLLHFGYINVYIIIIILSGYVHTNRELNSVFLYRYVLFSLGRPLHICAVCTTYALCLYEEKESTMSWKFMWNRKMCMYILWSHNNSTNGQLQTGRRHFSFFLSCSFSLFVIRWLESVL